jgi:predicted ATPase
MLKRLRLNNFKNFEEAELSMGPFTLLVGANAAGKSNIREALRFLHAVGRGYKLAEIFDEKWSAGERQWDGIRGGQREASFRGAGGFAIEVDFDPPAGEHVIDPAHFRYSTVVSIGDATRPSRVEREGLFQVENGQTPSIIVASLREGDGGKLYEKVEDKLLVTDTWPMWRLSPRLMDNIIAPVLRLMRFIDLDPSMMRRASSPGQTTLTDRGENLSSVLQTLCADASTKEEIIGWLRLLTPMDVDDLRFEADVRGHVILMIVEKDGHAYSAYSASDGTLRFLGILAALFSPESGLVFFEEVENGFHPARLRLLVDLIRSRTRDGKVQVVATTHSPTLLSLLDEEMLQHASLVYRLEGEPSSRITRLLDVPDAARVLATHDRADLLASGWFEDMVEFAAVPAEPIKKKASGEETAA